MKTFQQKELSAAYRHAIEGGQALHLMDGSFAYLRSTTPDCFKNRKQLAHLFDQDAERLTKTAKKLGVRVILIEHPGTSKQHIDLCGRPLDRALELAKQDEWEATHGFDFVPRIPVAERDE